MKKTTIKDVAEVIEQFLLGDPNAQMLFTTYSFNKKGDVIRDTTFVHAGKDTIKIALEGTMEQLEKETDEFINW